jgi:hypothetical protein
MRTGGHAGEAGGVAAASGEDWSLFMDLAVLEAATDSFSDDNLLGRGGFGPVYKVTALLSEQSRAVQLIFVSFFEENNLVQFRELILLPVTSVLIFARIARIIESGRIGNCFVFGIILYKS